MTVDPAFLDFLADLSARLPMRYRFDTAALDPANPIAKEVAASLSGAPASLPYCGSVRVNWVTLAPSSERLREVIEDLRNWVLPSFGWAVEPEITLPDGSGGAFAAALIGQSPTGYFRWQSQIATFETLVERIGLMRTVSEKAPARSVRLRPTLDILRREFTIALAVGDLARGRAAVTEIDRRQLDSAANSFAMQVRLASAFGDDAAIVSDPRLPDAVQLPLPARIRDAILAAHYRHLLAPLEAKLDWGGAIDAYGEVAHLLSGLTRSASSNPLLLRMNAYCAAFEGDTSGLAACLTEVPGDPVILALIALGAGKGIKSFPTQVVEPAPTASPTGDIDANGLAASAVVGDEKRPTQEDAPSAPRPAQTTIDMSAEQDGEISLSWAGAAAIIADGRSDALDAFLRQLQAAPDSLAIGNGEELLELFLDEAISSDPRRHQMAERVLTEVIDAYVCEPRFPRRGRLTFYLAVVDIWVDLRQRSTDPTDGQMLLLLADALLTLDGAMEAMVAQRLERWWEARPVRSRLAWLGEALELLTEQSASKAYLALWFTAAKLVRQDAASLSASDFRLWSRLGRRLDLEAAAIAEALGDLPATASVETDPVATAGFAKIAIVSLHERAAKAAAEEIAQRSGAHVIVVTDHAAGEATESAASADVILFVWGATKHAVYRAFDKVRDRLEYVQGTGSASIVRALERRASQIITA